MAPILKQIGDVLKGLQKGVGHGSTVSNTDIVNGLKEAPQIGAIGPSRTLCRAFTFDADQYVTDKALDGLFLMVAEEGKKIRQDPMARTTDLLKKVLSSRDACLRPMFLLHTVYCTLPTFSCKANGTPPGL